MTADGMVVTAILLIAFGMASELVLGSFSRFFDWRWPKQKYPTGGTHVKVLGGRVALLIGAVLLIGSALAVWA